MDFNDFMKSKGWDNKIGTNDRLLYSHEGEEFKAQSHAGFAPSGEWAPDVHGMIYQKGDLIVALFSDEERSWHQYMFGNGATEFAKDYAEFNKQDNQEE